MLERQVTVCISSLLNDSAHNTTSSPRSWKCSHQNPCHAAVLQKQWFRHCWSVQKILNSRRERKWKAACLAPSWVWKLWKVYIPLHKEREQEAMKEKSHYVEMVTFSWGYTGQMSISQKNVNQSLGKETESNISDSRQKKRKKRKKNFRRTKNIIYKENPKSLYTKIKECN